MEWHYAVGCLPYWRRLAIMLAGCRYDAALLVSALKASQ